MSNKFGSSSVGLGDLLLLTSVCKYFPNKFTIQLPENKSKYSILFHGLAEVEITNDINFLPDIGDGHYSTRKLRNFFKNADSMDNRPLVLYTDEESEKWAWEYLKDIKNPIIICPTCSESTGGKDNIRSFNDELIKKLTEDFIQQDFTPIIHSFDSTQEYPENIKVIRNLDLKKYICLLRKIGRFFGCNTGDMHLSVALGCISTVIQPQSTYNFSEIEWSYNHPSITYFNF